MKNIAIFCDGTWQYIGQPFPTNVARLARAVAPSKPADAQHPEIQQVVYYDNGVGVGQGVLNAATRLVGGGLGEGLDYKIAQAYEFLCLNYCPGDLIFLFGFSRGAYTARSLGGLLRKCWILKRENVSLIDEAMKLYRSGSLDSPELTLFKRNHCYPAEPFTQPRESDPKMAARTIAAADLFWGHVQYVGVWDTVGELGIPKVLPFAPDFNAKYEFHDLQLSRFVLSARQAVAIDERRKTFLPSLWNNVADLNENAGAGGLARAQRPYQQVWFPGSHSGVGGGENDSGLSLCPLLWISEGARAAGLEFASDVLDLYTPNANALAPFVHSGATIASLAIAAIGLADRQGPSQFEDVSEAACRRWAGVQDYRPVPLHHFESQLNQPAAAAAPHD